MQEGWQDQVDHLDMLIRERARRRGVVGGMTLLATGPAPCPLVFLSVYGLPDEAFFTVNAAAGFMWLPGSRPHRCVKTKLARLTRGEPGQRRIGRARAFSGSFWKQTAFSYLDRKAQNAKHQQHNRQLAAIGFELVTQGKWGAAWLVPQSYSKPQFSPVAPPLSFGYSSKLYYFLKNHIHRFIHYRSK